MRNLHTHLILLFVALSLIGCNKDEKATILSTVNTIDPSDVTGKSANCGGDVVNDGGSDIIERGVCYSSSGEPTTSDLKVTTTPGVGRFTVKLEGLTKNKVYVYKAYAINKAGTSYGFAKTFTTFPIPEVTLTDITSITMKSCVAHATFQSDDLIDGAGFCWSTSENPTLEDSHVEAWDINPVVSEITGLLPGTLYHVRAYATNAFGTGYSNDVTFTTASNDVPEVATLSISHYYLNSVTITGNVLNECGSATSRGFIWSYQSGVNYGNAVGRVDAGTGPGVFEAEISPTERNVQYYARAYAQNLTGISYGAEISFIYDLPSIHLYSVGDFAGNEISCGSYITSNGHIDIIAAGYCWSTTPDPDIDDDHNNSLESNPAGLQENTVYYIRAYVQNQVGISYSNQKSFNPGYKFGSQHNGGLVFYNDGNGHGLVCNIINISSHLYPWGCYGYIGTYDSLNASASNTHQILITCHDYTDMFAAKYADQLSTLGFSDWLLPSKEALDKIYDNLVAPGLVNIPVANRYWSSTEGGYLWAFSTDMTTGRSEANSRDSDSYVLPVRNF